MTNPIQRPAVFGVLLAAGSGSRLGLGPKGLLRKADGETLLESAQHALLAGGCGHVVLVLGAEAERVSAELAGHLHITVLVNRAWATGMGSSFAVGMAAVPEGSAALVALVDQPGLNAELVHRIMQAHRPGRITAAGYHQGDAPLRRGHPVLFAPNRTRPASSAATGDVGARNYLAANRELVDLVDCSDVDSGADIDTVADLHLLGE
ncbi:MAG: nucleotidyltransferase family protein [Paeniglutamicibacter sp.]